MTTLILKEYEIIGFFAPVTLTLPGHNYGNRAELDAQKILAFKYLMKNPNLSTQLKLIIADRFGDLVCHIEIPYSDEEKLKDLKDSINRRILKFLYSANEAEI